MTASPEPMSPPPTKPIPDIPDQPMPMPMPGDPPSGDRTWPPPTPSAHLSQAEPPLDGTREEGTREGPFFVVRGGRV
jgi:hypothetical protein